MNASNDLIRSLLKEKRVRKPLPIVKFYYQVGMTEKDDGVKNCLDNSLTISRNPPDDLHYWGTLEIEFDERKVIYSGSIYYLVTIEWDGQFSINMKQMDITGDVTGMNLPHNHAFLEMKLSLLNLDDNFIENN